MGVKFFNDINLESTGSINLGSTNYLTTDVGGQTDLFSNKNFIVSIGPSLSGVFEFAQNGIVTFLDDSTSTDFTFEPQNSSIRYTGLTYQGELYFDDSTLTASRQWILPDATGTVALTTDLDGSGGTLSNYLPLAGGTMTGDITMTSGSVLLSNLGAGIIDINDGSGGLSLVMDDAFDGIAAKLQKGNTTGFNTFEIEQITGGDGYLKIYVNDLNAGIANRNQTYIVSKNNANTFTTRLELANNSITADRTWTLPDATGTIALLSDIPTNAGDTLYVTDGSLTGNRTIDTTASKYKLIVENTSTSDAIALDPSNRTILYSDGTFEGSLRTNIITGNRIWDLPDASGTIALLSDLTNGIYTGSGNLSSNTVVSMHDGASPGTEFKLEFENVLSETVLSIDPSINSVGIGINSPLANLNVVGDTADAVVFKVDGTYGELFTITDNLTGVLFSVNNISGLPIFEVEDTDEIRMGKYTAVSGYTTGRNEIIATGDTIIHTVDISSYQMAVFEYVVSDGTNLRAGNVTAVTDGATVQSVETITTPSIGNTADVTMSVTIDASPGELNLVATTASTTGWTVKTIVRTI